MVSKLERKREEKRRYSRNRTNRDANIAPVPKIENPKLRAACAMDLELWHVEVFPHTTGLKPFGSVQKQSIQQSQQAIIYGGRVGKAEPRGYGKTTRGTQEAIWALLYNYRKFVILIGSSATNAKNMLDSIKEELVSNEVLMSIFPEVCYPFSKLEGFGIKGISQHIDGVATNIKMRGDLLVFPTVEGSASSGNCLAVKPLSNARGTNYKVPDGPRLRPDFVILDDIQSDDDADSPTTVDRIIKTVKKSVMRLGGHNKKLSAINNCTVIQEDDAAERLLNDPSWNSVRYKMLIEPSEQEELWFGEYAETRNAFDPDNPTSRLQAHLAALEFYKANRTTMDRGAKVSWEWAYEYDDEPQTEISAIQHAYNIWIDDGEAAFRSECQNDPKSKIDDPDFLTVPQIREKQHKQGRNKVPTDASSITAYVDVQKELLFYMVVAWTKQFDGFVIDYGTWPDQGICRFYKQSLKKTLSRRYPRFSENERLRLASDELADELLGRRYLREGDGAPMQIEIVGKDSRYKTSVLRRWYRDRQDARYQLCMGVGLGAKKKPMNHVDYHKKWTSDGRDLGPHWRIGDAIAGVRTMEIDTNWWKTFAQERFATALLDCGSISLYRDESENHQLVAEHIGRSEYRTALMGPYGLVDEWDVLPSSPDNDLFDCLVGNCALASKQGIRFLGAEKDANPSRRKKIDLSKWGQR